MVLSEHAGRLDRHVRMSWFDRAAAVGVVTCEPGTPESAFVNGQVLSALSDAVFRIVNWVMRLAPIGTFGALATVVATYGAQILQQQLVMVGVMMLTSKGTAGIAGGAFIVLASSTGSPAHARTPVAVTASDRPAQDEISGDADSAASRHVGSSPG